LETEIESPRPNRGAPIAAKHYLQVTDADFELAANGGGGAKSGAPRSGKGKIGGTSDQKRRANPLVFSRRDDRVPEKVRPTGEERPQICSGNSTVSDTGGAQSGAHSHTLDLNAIFALLPDDARQAIQAIIEDVLSNSSG
jgi:hypothetical protein